MVEEDYSEIVLRIDNKSINIHKINKIDFNKIKKMYPDGYGYNVIDNKKDVEWVEIDKVNFFKKRKR